MVLAWGAMTVLGAPSAAQQAPAARPAAAAASQVWTSGQVREAQQALTVARYDAAYYRGTVDGVIGRKTVEAIREYQRMHQLAVTGELSNELLAHLKANSTSVAAQPATAQLAAPPAAPPRESTPAAGAARTDTAKAAPAAAPRTPPAPAARATPAQQPRPATPAAAAAPMSREDIIAAQEGLARAELYEGTPSGTLDAPTVAAIRAFQAANDMAVDGALTASLLEHLKMVK
jgi:peptidoglycan hydrolase-like protein with peptidoglycan-binding domain